MVVQCLPSRLHGKDGGDFTFVDAEDFRERSPGSPKQGGVERAVVLKEDSQAFWDRKDRMAMGDVFDNFAVDVLCELHRSLCSTGGAYPTAFARECDKQGVLTAITVYPGSTVSEDAAV